MSFNQAAKASDQFPVCHTQPGAALPQVDTLVVTELPVGHITVVADDLADVLGGHVLLLRVHEPELPFLRIALGLQLLPFAGCMDIKPAASAPAPLRKAPERRNRLNPPFSCSFSSDM